MSLFQWIIVIWLLLIIVLIYQLLRGATWFYEENGVKKSKFIAFFGGRKFAMGFVTAGIPILIGMTSFYRLALMGKFSGDVVLGFSKSLLVLAFAVVTVLVSGNVLVHNIDKNGKK